MLHSLWAKLVVASLVLASLASAGVTRGFGGGGFGGGAYGGGAYGAGGGRFGQPGIPAGGPSGGYGGGYGGGAYRPGQYEAPQPYEFNYNTRDEGGNTNFRQESGDASGNVRGTYGYTDYQGLYRTVDYVADVNGFRANVKTNEPGTDNKNPADVSINAVAPPAGIYERYTRVGGGYAGGYGGGYQGGYAGSAGAGFHGKPYKSG